MSHAKAFTLVELLCSLVILMLLAAIGLPGLSHAKSKVKAVSCLGNLRQWGIATQLYTADHDDFLPPDGMPNPSVSATNSGWYVQLPAEIGLPPYHSNPWHTNALASTTSSVWLCPSNSRRSNGLNLFHYCLNEGVNGTGTEAKLVRISTLQNPSALVWLFDSKNLPAVGTRNFTHTNLHSRGASFLFLDGHAARYSSSAYWDVSVNRPKRASLPFDWDP